MDSGSFSRKFWSHKHNNDVIFLKSLAIFGPPTQTKPDLSLLISNLHPSSYVTDTSHVISGHSSFSSIFFILSDPPLGAAMAIGLPPAFLVVVLLAWATGEFIFLVLLTKYLNWWCQFENKPDFQKEVLVVIETSYQFFIIFQQGKYFLGSRISPYNFSTSIT